MPVAKQGHMDVFLLFFWKGKRESHQKSKSWHPKLACHSWRNLEYLNERLIRREELDSFIHYLNERICLI